MAVTDPVALEATWPWRVGQSVGRTLYACPPGSSYRDGEVLIGLMDSPELAQEAVTAHNQRLETDAFMKAIEAQEDKP